MKTGRTKLVLYALILSSLMTLVPFSENVRSSYSTQYITFEGTTAGQPYSFTNPVGNNFMVSDKSGVENTDFAVSSSLPKRGTRDFKLNFNPSNSGWWNFTYSNTSYMTNLSVWIYCQGVTTNYDFYFILFNRTLGMTGSEIIYLTKIDPDFTLSYLDEVGTKHAIADMTHSNYYELYCSITNSNGDVQYQYRNTTVNGVARHPELISAGYRIDSLYLQGTQAGGSNWYFDDCNVTISTAYGGGAGPSGTCDTSDMKAKGDVSQTYSYDYVPSNWWLKSNYNIPLKTTIEAVDLLVSNYQYNYISNDSSDYILFINGFYVGPATEILPYGWNYVIRWCNFGGVTIVNEVTVFEFFQSSHYYVTSGFTNYWLPSVTSIDVEPDGDTQFISDRSGGSGNYGAETSWAETLSYVDLKYKFYYYDIIIELEPPEFSEDKIQLSNGPYYVGKTVMLQYYVSSFTTTSEIRIDHNGTYVNTTSQGFSFPYQIPSGDDSGLISYTPMLTGSYRFSIYRSSVKKFSINITVSHTSDDATYLYVTPKPYSCGGDFKIYYGYHNIYGYPGLIMVGKTPYMNSTGDAKYYEIIDVNTSGYITMIGLTGTYYVQMFYNVGGVYHRMYDYDVLNSCLSDSSLTSSLTLKYSSITLDAPSYIGTQYIYYSHSYAGLGYQVLININDGLFADVSSSSNGVLEKQVDTAGYFIVDLILVSYNGTTKITTTINNVSYTVSGGGSAPSESKDPIELLGDFRYVFGFGIIIMFLLIPMAITSKLGIELPMIANIGSAAIGLSFSVYAGFLDQWVIFIVAIAMVVSAIVVVFR
jgi:hypothetical protein